MYPQVYRLVPSNADGPGSRYPLTTDSGTYEFVGTFDDINTANENEEDRDSLTTLLQCELRVGRGGPFRYGALASADSDSDSDDSSDLEDPEEDDSSDDNDNDAEGAATGGSGSSAVGQAAGTGNGTGAGSGAASGEGEAGGGDGNGGWARVLSSNGKFYFFHAATGNSQWTKPEEYDETADLAAEEAVRSGELDLSAWREAFDEDGDPYYYHTGTRETQWTAPKGWHVWKQLHGGGAEAGAGAGGDGEAAPT